MIDLNTVGPLLPWPPTIQELAYGVAGLTAARCWNVAKRLWLYRGEALPRARHFHKPVDGVWVFQRRDFILAIPRYMWSWLRLGFMWFDPYLGEPRSLLRWL